MYRCHCKFIERKRSRKKRRSRLRLVALNHQRKLFAMLKQKVMNHLQQSLDDAERAMSEMCGMTLYKSTNGFLPSQIYKLVGRNDNTAVLSFSVGSDMRAIYPDGVSVVFIYTLNERISLENDIMSLDFCSTVNAKMLLNGNNHSVEQKIISVNTQEIAEMIVPTTTKSNNKFYSKELRSPRVHVIPFDIEGNINWRYGFLKRMKIKEIALTPNEEFEYLAYKSILDSDNLKDEERNIIFNATEQVVNEEVARYILLWKQAVGELQKDDIEKLRQINSNRLINRSSLVEKELNKMGLSWEKLWEKYPEKCSLLFYRMIKFEEIRCNIVGKHLLYISFNSFLHIYLRHVKELKVEHQFGERDKFQLCEEDVLIVLRLVIQQFNDEYQIWKDSHPTGRFYRRGKKAYYYEGDYYSFDINPDGSVSTFYKCSGNRSK